METPAQRCARLIAAFEDLAGEETTALRARDFVAANAIAERAAPLVEWLANYGSVMTPPLRERLAAVYAKRAQNSDFLTSEIARAREELQQIGANRRRVAQIAPVYGSGSGSMSPRRLSAVG
jgi:hypothetical protein